MVYKMCFFWQIRKIEQTWPDIGNLEHQDSFGEDLFGPFSSAEKKVLICRLKQKWLHGKSKKCKKIISRCLAPTSLLVSYIMLQTIKPWGTATVFINGEYWVVVIEIWFKFVQHSDLLPVLLQPGFWQRTIERFLCFYLWLERKVFNYCLSWCLF